MTTTDPLDHARSFWKCASGFPPNKELVYPEHALAQEFDRWVVTDANTPPTDVLEYGCGGGSDAESYLRRGCWVTAVDISPINVATTHARLEALGQDVPHWATHVLERSDELPFFKDGTIDVASAHGVLHHIQQPLVNKVVAEIYRVLKPGGWFYAMLYTPALRASLDAEVKKHMRDAEVRISEGEAFGWATDGKGCPWAEPYDFKKAKKLFEPAGFYFHDCLHPNSPRSTFEYHEGFFACYRMQKPV